MYFINPTKKYNYLKYFKTFILDNKLYNYLHLVYSIEKATKLSKNNTIKSNNTNSSKSSKIIKSSNSNINILSP